MLTDGPFTDYLAELASARPTPGGGSAAAATGALGAALVSMVCNLTLDDAAYAGVHDEVRQMLAAAEALRKRLVHLAEEDATITAWLIPLVHEMQKATGPEHAALSVRVQAGLRSAAETPLETLQACADVLAMSERITEIGHAVALSDSGMAAAAAEAGMAGAALTVEINVGMVEDREYARAVRERVICLTAGVRDTRERVLESAYDQLRARRV